ncbi:SDR family NAD(P)-dependent oxidoreductase [Chloroflexota bacterium]
MNRLSGKVALVTGAAHQKGMGRAQALRLARDGADVVVVDLELIPVQRRGPEEGEDWQGLLGAVGEIEALGRRGLAVAADITNAKSVDTMAQKALDMFGKIDILVNNAGIVGSLVPAIQMTGENWEKVISVNLTGTFLCSKAVAKAMVERGEGGKIINVSSWAGKISRVNLSAYSASKSRVLSLTQTMALELAPYKINVNAICPGTTYTGINDQEFAAQAQREGITFKQAKDRFYDALLALIPLKCTATPDDIANTVAFFASSESDFITGQALNVDGGTVMGR